MSIGDQQDAVALAYGKAILARMAGGATLAQAVNQAYADVNPNDAVRIRRLIVASLVGIDLDTVPDPARHRFSQEDSGPLPPTG